MTVDLDDVLVVGLRELYRVHFGEGGDGAEQGLGTKVDADGVAEGFVVVEDDENCSMH
jgi:hypothetical protein